MTGYSDYSELFEDCILWFTGRSETNLGFPILPSGVTVTPSGTFSNDLDMGNNKSVKTFNGSTNYISLTDVTDWDIFENNFTICAWIRFSQDSVDNAIIGQYADTTHYWSIHRETSANQLHLESWNSSLLILYYGYTFDPTIDTWYHITISRSGTTCYMKLNGVGLSVGINTAWSGTTAVGASLTIGRGYDTHAGNIIYQQGNIKDLMIYNRALSLSEIKTIMRKTSPTTGEDMYPILSGERGVEL